MTDRELMQQALEVLERCPALYKAPEAATALRERLAQPQMQPCAGRNCGSTNPNLHSAECFEDYEKATGMGREQEAVAWMPIGSAPKGRIVLVYYKNSLGNGRTMRARYYLPETLESDTTESGWADEGWYEESEAYEYLMPLEHEPTHWMPLPPAPGIDRPPRTEQEPVAGMLDRNQILEWVNEYYGGKASEREIDFARFILRKNA